MVVRRQLEVAEHEPGEQHARHAEAHAAHLDLAQRGARRARDREQDDRARDGFGEKQVR